MSAARWKAFARRWRIGEVSAAALLLAAFLALVHRIYAPPPVAPPKPDRVLRIRIVSAPPRAEPSPFAYCRDALKAPERVEALPLPKDQEASVLFEQQFPEYKEETEDPFRSCGPAPSFPQMDNNGFLPFQVVNPWALSLRGFARTPRCRGCYSYPAALNSGTCHTPPPD